MTVVQEAEMVRLEIEYTVLLNEYLTMKQLTTSVQCYIHLSDLEIAHQS